MKKLTVIATAVAALAGLLSFTAPAVADGSQLPPNWHVHDGQTALGPQHKGIGFFPAILGVSVATYLTDPAACPDATDKAFLPQGRQDEQRLRSGMCQTSAKIIHLQTVLVEVAGPEGWGSITVASEPGWVTYFLVTDR